MGRRKTYNREELIEKSMEMFRDLGFNATSTQMLVDTLGVNRYSLFAEFGTKQGLFEAALERYDNEVIDRNFGPLETREAGADEIRKLFAFFASASKGPAAGRGCLLCNTAVEFGPIDPGGAGFVQRYFERITKAFLCALTHAQSRGELLDNVDPRKEADFFTTAVLGLFVLLRAKAKPAVIKRAAQVAVEHLQALEGQETK